MKTKVAIITIVLAAINLMSTTKLFAGNNDTSLNTRVKNTRYSQHNKQKELIADTCKEFKMCYDVNRQYLEDMVALPWLIREVVIKPSNFPFIVCDKKKSKNRQTAFNK